MKKRVTIKDVAKEANVSIATISYVINNKEENLSKETIERVNAAIKKLNYIPNMSARSLASKKSNLLGVVIPQTEVNKQIMLNNPFYSEFISGIEYTARLEGYHIIMSGVEIDKSYLDISVKRNLDGIIILGMYPQEFYNELKKSQIPIVLVDSYCNDHYFHSVQINDRYGGYIATKYLLEKGHRNIGLVTGKIKKEGVSEKRYLGYKDALAEFKVPFNPNYVFEGIVDYEYGLSVAEKIMKNKDITAVFATADILAIGLMKRLKSAKVRIPDDISVIGFDDIYITKFIDPGLTTVKQNIYKKGETAVKLILNCINKKLTSKHEIILPIEIVERESVKEI
ncbi:MAG TPA: LacI family transcriptional regulator [Clostridiaceae bacterium]|nr:LacI family transcriptional regulator [Clostridiaceae bacterium]